MQIAFEVASQGGPTPRKSGRPDLRILIPISGEPEIAGADYLAVTVL